MIMSYIKGQNRGQITLLPKTIYEYISKDNPVNVIDAFIENLDLDKTDFRKDNAKELIALDGSKFRIVNSKDNNFTLAKLTNRSNRIDQHIWEYMKELDSFDKKEINSKEYTK
jgi:hypothetical protein